MYYDYIYSSKPIQYVLYTYSFSPVNDDNYSYRPISAELEISAFRTWPLSSLV